MPLISSLNEVTPGLSIHLNNYAITSPDNWQFLLDRARAADQAGVDRIVVSDHVVFGEHLENYARAELGGAEGGKQPTDSDGVWLEPMTVLSIVSGITSRIRLSTGILLAALRRPVVLAKAAATLDVLSGGRLDLGVGVGWQREEYEAAGLSFDARGEILDHTLEVCQTLWRDNPAKFESDELRFEAIHCVPQPIQPGGVPIWVSGTMNPRVLRRLVRFGSGWIPWGPDQSDPTRGVAKIRRALTEAGRDPIGFQVRGGLPIINDSEGNPDFARTVEIVPSLVDGGITDFHARPTIPENLGAATDYLAALVSAFRQSVGRAL
jgi:probable F420-dependent oxidoreductase